MKTINQIAFVLITAAAASSLTSCNEKKPVENSETNAMTPEEESDARVDEMRDNIKEEREQFIVQARARIEKNKKDIEDLKVVAKSKQGEAKAKYDQAIDNLRAENDKLEERIDDNKEAMNEKWDNFKEEFNSDMDNLGTSIADLFKDNK